MAGCDDLAPEQSETMHFRVRAGRTKRERSRAALLAAAGRLFARRGWEGTRLEDVAQEAGLGVTTIYAHFPSKQALLATVYASCMQPLLAFITNAALLRVLTHPRESAEETKALVLSLFLQQRARSRAGAKTGRRSNQSILNNLHLVVGSGRSYDS